MISRRIGTRQIFLMRSGAHKGLGRTLENVKEETQLFWKSVPSEEISTIWKLVTSWATSFFRKLLPSVEKTLLWAFVLLHTINMQLAASSGHAGRDKCNLTLNKQILHRSQPKLPPPNFCKWFHYFQLFHLHLV